MLVLHFKSLSKVGYSNHSSSLATSFENQVLKVKVFGVFFFLVLVLHLFSNTTRYKLQIVAIQLG